MKHISEVLEAATSHLSCPDCDKAAADLWHGYSGPCIGCVARAVSRSPQHFEAMQAGRQTRAYRDLCKRFGVTHEQVRAAFEADAINRTDE